MAWGGEGPFQTDVFQDRRPCDLDAEFHDLAADALCAPQAILRGHLLDQGDGFECYLGTPGVGPGLELPEQPGALTMPAQEGVRLEDGERLFPTVDPAAEEGEPWAIGLGELWFLHPSLEDDQLLAQVSILSD
jgi:hypothetical protein